VHSVFAEWSTANTITECHHTLADCLASLPICFLASAAHMKPRDLPRATLPTCPCCTLYEQHTPCAHRHTHKHYIMLMCYCSRFRATQMSQRYARVPFLLCKFHAHACSNPGRLCQRYAPVLTFMYISLIWLRQQLQKALACCGLVCLQQVTRFLQQPTSSGAIQRRHCCKVSRHRLTSHA
jgi:hypothetical protein